MVKFVKMGNNSIFIMINKNLYKLITAKINIEYYSVLCVLYRISSVNCWYVFGKFIILLKMCG